jgi:hypothetical protein
MGRGDMAKTTTDHETIRRWAENKGGKPAAVRRTHQGDDVGIIRIMFPNAPQSEHDELVEISWDEFFEDLESATSRCSTMRRACSTRSSVETPPSAASAAITKQLAPSSAGVALAIRAEG